MYVLGILVGVLWAGGTCVQGEILLGNDQWAKNRLTYYWASQDV